MLRLIHLLHNYIHLLKLPFSMSKFTKKSIQKRLIFSDKARDLVIILFCLINFTTISTLSAKYHKRLPNQTHHQIKTYDRNQEHCQRKLSKKQQELLKHYYEKKQLEHDDQSSDINSEES